MASGTVQGFGLSALAARLRMSTELAKQIVQTMHKLGPYLLVELLLPGGTLIALLLWLYRQHGKPTSAGARSGFALPAALAWMRPGASALRHGQR